jgi:Calx-beta domain
VKESVGLAQIPVTRVNGCDGKVTLTWKTEDVTAVSGKDYDGCEGTIVFEHGETAKMIEVPIHNDLVREGRDYVIFITKTKRSKTQRSYFRQILKSGRFYLTTTEHGSCELFV